MLWFHMKILCSFLPTYLWQLFKAEIILNDDQELNSSFLQQVANNKHP